MAEETGFIQRWSRRKIDTKSEIKEEVKNNIDSELINIDKKEIESSFVTSPTSEILSSPASGTEEYKTDEDMVPLEQLTEDSDYSGFLSPRVSEALRKQALRKLFHLPFLNVVDGLDDYAEDFTSFASLGDIIPHEMKRMLEREKEKELAEAKEAEEKEKLTLNDDLNDMPDAKIELSKEEYDVFEHQVVIDEPNLINQKEKHKNDKLN